ncbi:MAG: DUF3820 family protein, partial [Akkermansiaceae bacterium]|nr:DUF3820 family protein [Akkermansiaceae bacterium]
IDRRYSAKSSPKMNLTEIDREDFRNLLEEIAGTHMPFGKYGIEQCPPRGAPIMDLPLEYLVWFDQRGYPKGRLGELLAHVHEIKAVGMDAIFDPFRQARGGRFKLKKPQRRNFRFD